MSASPESTVAGPVRPQAGAERRRHRSAAQARVIAVCSGKGGVGKTTLATNLSFALAKGDKRVCIFDADVSLANVNILLGLTPKRTLVDYVSGEVDIDDVLIDAPASVKIIPGGGRVDEFIHLNERQQLRLLDGLRRLESAFDYLVVDTAAGLSESQLQLIQAAPFVLVTITEEPTSLTDAFSLLKVLKRRGFSRPVLVVVNMATSSGTAQATFRRFKDAAFLYLKLTVHYLGYVVRDHVVVDSVRHQMPYVLYKPEAMASRCLGVIAQRLRRLTEGARSVDGGFSTFFDALKLNEDAGNLHCTRSEILQQLDDHLSRMERADAEAFLQEILTHWSGATGEPLAVNLGGTDQGLILPIDAGHADVDGEEQEGLFAALQIAARSSL